MYSDSLGFVSSVDKGLKIVASACGTNEKLSSYYARHSWATIVHNKCKISKSDVDECLNHVDKNSRMADI
jgi:integrase